MIEPAGSARNLPAPLAPDNSSVPDTMRRSAVATPSWKDAVVQQHQGAVLPPTVPLMCSMPT